MIERSLSFSGPASPGHTLAPQRRGPGDPCFQIDGDGAIWRTSLQTSGPVTARISRVDTHTVVCQAWGEGAEEFTEALPALLGADDDATGFTPSHPTVAAAADLKFWKTMPFYYDVQASFTHNIVFANLERFNALPEAVRSQLREAAAAAERRAVANVIALEEQQRKMVTENGMKILAPDAKLLSEMRAAAKGVIDEWKAQAGPEAQRALTAIGR